MLLLFVSAALWAQDVAGDECLFCHRNNIGPSWAKDAHGQTIRPAENPGEFTLGFRGHFRKLKQSGYGAFEILSGDAWDRTKFAARCASCHTTGFDKRTGKFGAFAIECYVCHGDVPLEHSNDTSLVRLSKKSARDPREITSLCASCHVRDGNPGDRHVDRSVRDVIENGGVTTCLNCHQVHGNSTAKHRRLLTNPGCQDCHYAEGPKKNVKASEVHSALCEY